MNRIITYVVPSGSFSLDKKVGLLYGSGFELSFIEPLSFARYSYEALQKQYLREAISAANSKYGSVSVLFVYDSMVPQPDKISSFLSESKEYEYEAIYLYRSMDRCDKQTVLDGARVRPSQPQNLFGLFLTPKGQEHFLKFGELSGVKKIASKYNLLSMDTSKVEDVEQYSLFQTCLRKEDFVKWPYSITSNSYSTPLYVFFILVLFLIILVVNRVRRK